MVNKNLFTIDEAVDDYVQSGTVIGLGTGAAYRHPTSWDCPLDTMGYHGCLSHVCDLGQIRCTSCPVKSCFCRTATNFQPKAR